MRRPRPAPFFIAIVWLLASTTWAGARDREGRHGIGHEQWHGSFYSKLVRPDTKTSCCSLADCSPTTSRQSPFGYYEVLVEGEWVIVPQFKIVPVSAPDGGAHVCAPKQQHPHKGVLYCVVLPPEG